MWILLIIFIVMHDDTHTQNYNLLTQPNKKSCSPHILVGTICTSAYSHTPFEATHHTKTPVRENVCACRVRWRLKARARVSSINAAQPATRGFCMEFTRVDNAMTFLHAIYFYERCQHAGRILHGNVRDILRAHICTHTERTHIFAWYSCLCTSVCVYVCIFVTCVMRLAQCFGIRVEKWKIQRENPLCCGWRK